MFLILIQSYFQVQSCFWLKFSPSWSLILLQSCFWSWLILDLILPNLPIYRTPDCSEIVHNWSNLYEIHNSLPSLKNLVENTQEYFQTINWLLFQYFIIWIHSSPLLWCIQSQVTLFHSCCTYFDCIYWSCLYPNTVSFISCVYSLILLFYSISM